MKNKPRIRQIFVIRFVYVNAREWTGVDIDGKLAIPINEFLERLLGGKVK